jgi:arabinogalactan oligomer/maltooligosaccharide transport system substrate-binding protein
MTQPSISRFIRRSLLIALLIVLLTLLVACEESPSADEATIEQGAIGQAAAVDGAQAAGAATAAPGGGQSQSLLPTATPTPTPLAGRIVLWHSWAEGDGDALAAILQSYQRAQPNVVVDTLYVAYSDLAQAYADAVASGGGPDLVLAPNWWLNGLTEATVVQPLDDLLSAEELASYWPAALDNFRLQGRLYGLPTNYEVTSVFVNRSLADPSAMPATLDEWLAQAQQSPSLGIGLYNNLYHLAWGLPAYGARLFDENGVAVLDQGGDAAGYLRWLRTLSQTQGSYVDPDYGMLKDRFRKGEFAYFVDGPWAIDELRGALGENLAVAPLPAGPAGAAQPWLSADGILFNPNMAGSQQELALSFARFLTTAESGAAIASLGKRLPAARYTAFGDDLLLQGFARQADTAQPMPSVPEMAYAWGYGGDMFIKVVDGDADPAATVIESAALINDASGK